MLKKIILLILICTLGFSAALSLTSCDDNEDTGDTGDTGDDGTGAQTSEKVIYTITVVDEAGVAVKGAVVKLFQEGGEAFERTTNGEGRTVASLVGASKVQLVSVPEGYFMSDSQINTQIALTGKAHTITVANATYKFTVKDTNGSIYPGAEISLYAYSGGEVDTTSAVATATTNASGVAYAYLAGGKGVYLMKCKLLDAGDLYVEDFSTSAAATEYELSVLAPRVSGNPITSAKVNEGDIQLIYMDNTKQNLGTLPLREGYNSAVVSCKYDALREQLILTLIDSSAINVANELISDSLKTMTVRLREMNGKLEWTPEGEENWQTLCDAVTNEIPLLLLAETTEFGKHGQISGDGVVFAISDNSLRFRAREWKAGIDFVMDAKLNGGIGNNKFNITYLAEINSNADLSSTSAAASGYKVFKNAGDDITPINMNGTYIGANHGYYIIAELPNTTGLTEEDIGSIWQVGTMKYVLVRITPASKLWFCPYYDSAMRTGKFDYQRIRTGNTVTHVSGATHTDSFTVTADSTQQQFYFAISNSYDAVFLNGTQEIDLAKSGYYTAEFVDFYEEYDVMYLPAILEYLIANVGNNTNYSYHDESITESYVTFRNTYRFHKNGACVVYSSYEFHKDVSIGYIGGVQSVKFDESTHYVYVPGTKDLSTPTLQGNANINVGSNNLADPDTLVTSYFQLTDENGTKALNLGFNPLFGTAVNDVRKNLTLSGMSTNLGWYYTSYKLYPKLISGVALSAGDKVTCVAYRLPSYVLDDDFTAINWYWVGDDIFLSLHTDKAVDKTVTVLPEYMNGMEITVIEGSDTFTVKSEAIEDGSISVTSTDAGYTIVKLSASSAE